MFLALGTFDVAGVANIGLPMIVVCIPAFLALMFVLTIKLRKSPFDLSYSHHAHQELVKGVTTEMSGRTLAKVEVMHWCETTLFLGWVAMFFIWDNPVSIVLAVVVASLAFFLEILIDNNFARVKWQNAEVGMGSWRWCAACQHCLARVRPYRCKGGSPMSYASKSPWVIHYDGSSCNGCDIEVLAALCPGFDVERFGVMNTGNPKHADIFLVTGA